MGVNERWEQGLERIAVNSIEDFWVSFTIGCALGTRTNGATKSHNAASVSTTGTPWVPCV